MGGGSCTDSNTDEEQAILIPQEALSATIAADSGLKHTVSFETTGEWQASVESPGSGDTWITLSPTFGNAGKNTITATLTENIQPTSRKAVITILCGTESAAITITQQGTGTSEEPAKPEHPEISPENRLTYIEVSENKKTTTEDGTEESTTQGYIDLIYDAQGVLTNFNYYTFDRNQPDKLNGSSKTVLNWGANKFSLSQYNIEITSYSSIPRITKDDRSESYQLNKSGLISQYSYFDDNRDVFIYNPDGTLATKESYWIFHKDGDDFDLKVSDPKNPSYLLIANDPEMESIIGALNALILNRLVTRVNTGQGKNIPVSIIVDELPTLYFHKIDRLIGTARSNKVSVTLGFQELPQLEADYGKVGMQKIITTVGNVVSGSARSKETLEWLSNDIFGKVVQLKKGVTIDRDKTSINLNENMDSLVPASKISDMPTGWICGQTARDFVKTKVGNGGTMNIQESEEFKTTKFFCKTDFDMAEIKKEEEAYVPLPKFYTFNSRDERERILYKNFVQVGLDVKEMIKDVLNKRGAK